MYIYCYREEKVILVETVEGPRGLVVQRTHSVGGVMRGYCYNRRRRGSTVCVFL